MKHHKIVYIIMISMIGCRKQSGDLIPTQYVAEEVIPGDNARVAGVIREVAEILEQVYLYRDAYNEINAAVYSAYYEDERVLLKDLLFPETSRLYQSEKFLSLHKNPGEFKKRFCGIIDKNKHPLLYGQIGNMIYPETARVQTSPVLAYDFKILTDSVDVFSDKAGIAIYFPYSENFPDFVNVPPGGKITKMQSVSLPVIVASDRDADEGIGRQPYYCTTSPDNLCYREIRIDDAYAERKPVHIVTTGAVIRSAATNDAKATEIVNRVYHGWSRLIRQMDKLISLTGNGGGSEIKIGRVNNYLRKTADEQINDFAGDVVTVYYTRADIRKKRWKRVYSVWDPNWSYQDTEQIYAVYEEDTKGQVTLDGSVNAALTLPGKPSLGKVSGDIGFKISLSTQDDIITQRKIDRKSFYAAGAQNNGWGYMKDTDDFLPANSDWPIYDGGSIWSYTMPYHTY